MQLKQEYSHLSFSANINRFQNQIFSKNLIQDFPAPINLAQPLMIPNRTVTKCSYKKGKRKSVKTVLGRFFRLHWGGWIHTRSGRNKHMWKKSFARKKKLKQHVFCNATQSTTLDKMVTKFWKRPKYYIDDMYEPYHRREEFPLTRISPLVRPEDLK